MKFKTITTILLTSVFLFACDDETTSNNITENDSDSSAVEIEKNPSVSLPVDIFVNSDYDKFAGEKIIFTRSITSVSITDFAEDEEISFKKKYGNTFSDYNLDLVNNYKKLKIKMSHDFNASKDYEKRESFMFDKNTTFVAGDYELIANEVVNKQLQFLSTDYKVGGSYETSSEIEIAIPNEFISDHLQLKTTQQLDDEYKTIFIDLVNKK